MPDSVQPSMTFRSWIEPPKDSVHLRETLVRIKQLAIDDVFYLGRFFAATKAISAIAIVIFEMASFTVKAAVNFTVCLIMLDPAKAVKEIGIGVNHITHLTLLGAALAVAAVVGIFIPRFFDSIVPNTLSIEDQIQKKEREAKSFQAKIESLKRANDTLKAEKSGSAVKTGRFKEAQNQADSSNQPLEQLKKEKAQLERETTSAKKLLAKFQAEQEKLQSEAKEEKAWLEQEIASAKEKITKLKVKQEKLQSSHKLLKQEKQQINKEEEQKRAASTADLEVQEKDLGAKVKKHEEAIETLEGCNSGLLVLLDKVEEDFRNRSKEIQDLITRRDVLVAFIQGKEGELQNNKEALGELEKRIAPLIEEEKALSSSIADNKEQAQELKLSLADLEAKVKDLKAKEETKERRIEILEKNIKTLEEKKLEKENEIAEIRKQQAIVKKEAKQLLKTTGEALEEQEKRARQLAAQKTAIPFKDYSSKLVILRSVESNTYWLR